MMSFQPTTKSQPFYGESLRLGFVKVLLPRVVAFSVRDSYQGMPSGMPRAAATHKPGVPRAEGTASLK